MIVCAGNSESFDFATPVGIGLVESAINTTRLCIMEAPAYLLFVATAGSYGKHNIFDIVTSKSAANIELSFLEKKAYTPIDNLIVSEESSITSDVIINSSNYITTDEELSKKMSSLKIDLENMEFFSIMRTAQEFNIPCGGIFIVTNHTNSDAHSTFISNHAEAMQKLDTHVKELIAKGLA